MKSVKDSIKKLKILKDNHKQHKFSEADIKVIDDMIKYLEGIEKRDKIKDYAEISQTIASVLKLMTDLFKSFL